MKDTRTLAPVGLLRLASALGTLDDNQQEESEIALANGIRSRKEEAVEALLALRCFDQLKTGQCIDAVLSTSRGSDPDLQYLAVRVLLNNCTGIKAAEDVVAAYNAAAEECDTMRLVLKGKFASAVDDLGAIYEEECF